MAATLILVTGLVFSLAGLWAVGFFRPGSVRGPARWSSPGDGGRVAGGSDGRVAGGDFMILAGMCVLALVGWLAATAAAIRVAQGVFGGGTAATILAVVAGYAGGMVVLLVPPLSGIASRRSPGGGLSRVAGEGGGGAAKDVLAGLVGLLLALPWVYAVQALTVKVLEAFRVAVEPEHELLRMLREHGTGAVAGAVVLSAVFAAPVFEELMFRRTVQTLFVRAGERRAGATTARWLGIVGASLCFALLHPAWSIPAIFTLSLALGYVYERRGSLLAPLALHAGFNALSVAVAVFSPK